MITLKQQVAQVMLTQHCQVILDGDFGQVILDGFVRLESLVRKTNQGINERPYRLQNILKSEE